MKKTYFRTSIAAALMLATIPTVAIAESSDISFATGQEGKGYYKFGVKAKTRLEAVMKNTVTLNPLAGSDEISSAVCEGTSQLGVTQIGGVRARELDSGCSLKVVGFYGKENALIMFPPDSDYGSLSDLEKGNKILVDAIGSGTDLWWTNAVSIETGENGNKSPWHQASRVNDLLISTESLYASSEIDAVIMVTQPKTNSVVQSLLSAGWEVGDLYDKDINDELFRKKVLYEAVTVHAGDSWSGSDDGYGYEVSSVIIANEEWLNNLKKDRPAYAKLLNALNVLSREQQNQ